MSKILFIFLCIWLMSLGSKLVFFGHIMKVIGVQTSVFGFMMKVNGIQISIFGHLKNNLDPIDLHCINWLIPHWLWTNMDKMFFLSGVKQTKVQKKTGLLTFVLLKQFMKIFRKTAECIFGANWYYEKWKVFLEM